MALDFPNKVQNGVFPTPKKRDARRVLARGASRLHCSLPSEMLRLSGVRRRGRGRRASWSRATSPS